MCYESEPGIVVALISGTPDISSELKTECHMFLMAFLGLYQQMREGTMTKYADE